LKLLYNSLINELGIINSLLPGKYPVIYTI